MDTLIIAQFLIFLTKFLLLIINAFKLNLGVKK